MIALSQTGLSTSSDARSRTFPLIDQIGSLVRVADFVAPPSGCPSYVRLTIVLDDLDADICHKEKIESFDDASTEVSTTSVAGRFGEEKNDDASDVCAVTLQRKGAVEAAAEPLSQEEISAAEDEYAASAQSKESDEITSDNPTTLMISNIPCRCRSKDVLEAVRDLGFYGQFDFFYLPMRGNKLQNFGYAFISLNDSALLPVFRERAEGYVMKGRRSNKALSVQVARIQGYKGNLEHHFGADVVSRHHAPVFFVEKP
eukprot:TRINITY_DN76821_c0_g1_i1.p1 TRINITY_DN76821_c0_g1~~TRINITY_DN76821_c0_g1_i1.p1  ORF type:complete len:258 (+),score=36.28 TRINITY_DN76821_c0_g1_i1:96-869(+)